MARVSPGRAARRRAAPLPESTSVPLGHPAMWTACVLVALVLVLCVTYALFEPDFWQHLLVGKVIWQTHSVSTTQIWTWPNYGQPDITPSWLFRALIWPVWSFGGIWGLFFWRWITTLVTFGLLWATGRQMGARGFAALGVLVLCGLAYQTRSQIRPETLVAVLMALEIWILETRRQGGRDRSPWLIAVAWAWANAHISYYLGFAIFGAYLADDLLRARRGVVERGRALRLGLVALAALAISFVNPFGWRALWQPFDYYLHLRHEPLFQGIDELLPFDWRANIDNGLLLLVIGWPVLVLRRIRQGRLDLVDALFCGLFTLTALSAQRFFGFYALAAAPFIMRNLDEWVTARRWPSWSGNPWVRAGAVAVLTAVVGYGQIARPWPRVGIGIDEAYFPVRACDFIAEQGVQGRAFNQFYEGGYLLHRFWPDRQRLPFLDIHQSGDPGIRLLYTRAFESRESWIAADSRFGFDVVLLDRYRSPKNPLLDVLDADSMWALVFVDDAAALWVRRAGPLAGVAARFGYRYLPAGEARTRPLGEACARDSALRQAVKAELQRAADASPWNATALSLLANIALSEGRYREARDLLVRGLRLMPGLGRAHERLGLIALEEGRSREALREFQRERALDPRRAHVALLVGRSWQQLGDLRRARDEYRRGTRLDPSDGEAQDSLRAAELRLGR